MYAELNIAVIVYVYVYIYIAIVIKGKLEEKLMWRGTDIENRCHYRPASEKGLQCRDATEKRFHETAYAEP